MSENKCPFCLKIGKNVLLQLYQINYKEAVYMCPEKDCKYPENTKYIIIQREFFDKDYKVENDSTDSDIEEITKLFTERARKKIKKKYSFESLLSDQEGSSSDDEKVIKKAYNILLGNVLKKDIDHVKILEENAELLGILKSQEKISNNKTLSNKNIISDESDFNINSFNLSADTSFNSLDSLDLKPVLEESTCESKSDCLVNTFKIAKNMYSSQNNIAVSQKNNSEYCNGISKKSPVKNENIRCQSEENVPKDTIFSNNRLEERKINDISKLLDNSSNDEKIETSLKTDLDNVQNLLNISQDVQTNISSNCDKSQDKNLDNTNGNSSSSIVNNEPLKVSSSSSSLNDISILLDIDSNQNISSNSNVIEKCLKEQSNSSINNDNTKQSLNDITKLIDISNDVELAKTVNNHYTIVEPQISSVFTKSENVETNIEIESSEKGKIKYAIPIKIKVLKSPLPNKFKNNSKIQIQTASTNKISNLTKNDRIIDNESKIEENNIYKLITKKNLSKIEISKEEILGLKQYIKTSSQKNKVFEFRNKVKKNKIELSKGDISAALRASGVTENAKLNIDIIKKPTQIRVIPGKTNKTMSNASRFEGFSFTTKIIKPANTDNDNSKKILNLTITSEENINTKDTNIEKKKIIQSPKVASVENLNNLTVKNNSVGLENIPVTASSQETDIIDDFLKDIDLNITNFIDDSTADTNLDDVDDWLKSLVN